MEASRVQWRVVVMKLQWLMWSLSCPSQTGSANLKVPAFSSFPHPPFLLPSLLYLADGNDVSCTSYSDPHPTLHGLLCKDRDGSFVAFPADAILNIISRGRRRDIAGRRGFSFWFRCPYYSGVPFRHLRCIMVSSSRWPAACFSTAFR